MRTGSKIGIQLTNGPGIRAVHCQYDGHPDANGSTLCTEFNTPELVGALVDGGDMSSLWTDEDWPDEDGKRKRRPAAGPLYYSTRGGLSEEELDSLDPVFAENVRQFLDYAKEDGAEYAYYFANTGKWICHDLYAGKEITLEQDHSENTTHQPATKRRDTRK